MCTSFSQIPYQTIQRIFSMPLGLNNITSAQDRETKLKLRLQKIKVLDFMCTLNKVFNVNFEKTPLYVSLSSQQKVIALQKILKQLCYIVSTQNNTLKQFLMFVNSGIYNVMGHSNR